MIYILELGKVIVSLSNFDRERGGFQFKVLREVEQLERRKGILGKDKVFDLRVSGERKVVGGG